MKCILTAVFLAFAALPAAAQMQEAPDGRIITSPAAEQTLLDNKVYFFAHSMCNACKDAFVYFNTYHRDLNLPITDMKFHHNLELYKQCVKKFDIQNSELRLPLICMGNHFIMGWEPADQALFEQYLKEFNAQNPVAPAAE